MVHDIYVDLVFVTRYRGGVLDEEMLTACERVMAGLCTEMGADLREFNGGHGHVHLLVRYPPKLAVSTLVNRLKAVSAHYLRAEFTGRVSPHLMHGHLWSPSYFAASAGSAPLTVISQYIENQNRPGQDDPISPGPEPNGQGSSGHTVDGTGSAPQVWPSTTSMTVQKDPPVEARVARGNAR